MRKTSEYRHHRDECRALARKAENDEQRSQLLKMAEIWDKLAQERERSELRIADMTPMAGTA
jgi:hypothetical protein